LDRQIELEPDQPLISVGKAQSFFFEKADVKGARAAYEALPSSAKDDPGLTAVRIYLAMCARDFGAAEEIIKESPNEEIFFLRALVPRQIWTLWLEFCSRKPSHDGTVWCCA
jgi:hypothetical protein